MPAKAAETTEPVGVYARISDDTAGDALGVKRQEDDSRALAKLRGWEVAKAYIDNSVSAYKRKPRPEFEAMLTDLAAGSLGGIVVYDLDRLMRRPSDLERLLEIYDERPALRFATVTGEIDLSTSDGRTMARVLVAFANKSSADAGRRIKRKHLELALNGVPVGGTRPFGWLADKRTLDPTEAPIVREAADRLLAGSDTFSGIVRDWNERGLRTTRGNPWQRQTVRLMLLSPRMAGFRVHQEEIMRDEAGEPVTANDPIISPEEHERLIGMYGKPLRNKPGNGGTRAGARKYLLSGTVRCGVCGTKLVGNAQKGRPQYLYRCPPVTAGGCGKVGVSGVSLDELVSLALRTHLSKVSATTSEVPWPGESALAMKGSQISELMTAYTNGEVSGGVAFPAIKSLEAEVANMRREQAAWTATHRAGSVEVSEEWEDMSVGARRTIVEAAVEAITIDPVGRGGGNAMDPERVHIVWKQ